MVCRLLANAMYLVFLLLVWLVIRIFRRLKLNARQEGLIYEARCERLGLEFQPESSRIVREQPDSEGAWDRSG